MRNDLTQKGVIFVEVPEVMELRHSTKDHAAFASEHFHIFSPGTLLSVLEIAGFTVIVIERDVSARLRRRVKVLAIMNDDAFEISDERYLGCAEKIIRYRDQYLRS